MPMIYTNYDTWVYILGDPTDFADYPLWIANYTPASSPLIPSAWSDWVFWQHSETGSVGGVSGNVDLDRFQGTQDDLDDFIEACDGDFSHWFSLDDGLRSWPAVGRNKDQRLEVFWRDADGALCHKWQLAPGSDSWSVSASLGTPSPGNAVDDPVVISDAEERLMVFVRDANGVPWYIRQEVANGSWDDWTFLGGVFESPPAVGRNQDERIEVFGRGTTGMLYHKWQLAPGSDSWSNWSSLDAPSGSAIHDPAVISDAEERLMVFVRDSNDALCYIRQVVPNGNWGAWTTFVDTLDGPPAVGRNQDERVEVFWRDASGALYHKWQLTPASDSWSSAASLGGLVYDPVVIQNAHGCLEVYVRGVHRKLWRIRQTASNNGWGSWEPLSGCCQGRPGVHLNAEGWVEIFVRGTDDGLWRRFAPSSLPGDSGSSIQSWNAFVHGNTLHQGYWRGNQGWYRTVPIADEAVQWEAASPWAGPILPDPPLPGTEPPLPGSGLVQSQDAFIIGNLFYQAFWRGDEGWVRNLPIVNGQIQWGSTDPAYQWPDDPIALSDLTVGSGSVLSQEAFIVGDTLHQTFFRESGGYYFVHPIVNGEPQWTGLLTPVSYPLPGIGEVQAQDAYVLGNKVHQTLWQNDECWYRTIPIANGVPQWQSASSWVGPVPL